MALRNLWFLRQMSLVFSFANFGVKGLALGFTQVESGLRAPVPTTQNDKWSESDP